MYKTNGNIVEFIVFIYTVHLAETFLIIQSIYLCVPWKYYVYREMCGHISKM